jgi:acetoin utilization protein AcuC
LILIFLSTRAYKPEVIVNQFGVDGHYGDPLVGLSLTTRSYIEIAETLHNLAHRMCGGKLLVLGGGGYDVKNTARCWAVMFATSSA